MKRSLRKAIAFLMAVAMVAGAWNVPAYAAEKNQTNSGSVTTLAEAIYDEAVTFSDSVAFLQNGHWSNEDGENVTKDTTIVFMDAQGNKSEFKNQDAKGNQIFDAIYPMISDGYHNFDAFKIIKDGKMSYIRAEVGHPYYGETLQWYNYALPISDDYMLVSEDGILTNVINVDGDVVLKDLPDVYYATAIGNCVYVQSGNFVYMIYDGNKVRNYDQFEDLYYAYENLGEGYALITGGEYTVLFDENGDFVESFQQLGNEEGTGVIRVDYVDIDTIESGYVVRRIEEKIYNPNGGYNYNYYYDIYNMKTDEVVAESSWYPEFDGNTIIGYYEDDGAYVASVDGTTYIKNIDDYVTEKLVTDSYEEVTYSFYYVNGSLLISLSDWADMEETETYVLTQETKFADASKKHSDGIVESISYDEEYVLTVDGEGYINTMLTTKGNKVKEYGDTDYQYGYLIYKAYMDETEYYEGEVEGFKFITYKIEDDGDYYQESQAYIMEDGSIYEYPMIESTTGNFLLAYEENEEGELVTYVINTDNKVVYSGVCYFVDVFWNADYFAVTTDTRCYLYDRDGNIVLGEDQHYVSIGFNFRSGYYPAHDEDYYGKYEYYDECRPNGLCVTLVETEEDSFKYGAISLAEVEQINGLCYDEASGNWYYYVNGKVDTTYTGLAQNDYGWWYVKNGQVDFSYDGVASNESGTWYIENGQVDFGKSGLQYRSGKWYLFDGGRVNRTTTLAYYNGIWWYVANGEVDFSADTLSYYNGIWWYVEDGKVDFGYDGVSAYNGETWYIEDGKVDFSKSGLQYRNGTWYLFAGGKVNRITTLSYYNGTWWYVANGQINFNYDGVAAYNGETWYIENGKVDFSKSGLQLRNGTWYLFNGGKVNRTTTLAYYNGTWWYVANGEVDFSADTLAYYNGIWWYVENGKVDFSYDGVSAYNGETWYIENGQVDFGKSGLQYRSGTWYLFNGGKVNRTTTLSYYNGIWWYVEDGEVDFEANTVAYYNNIWWYVEDGKVDFSYNGTFTDEAGTEYTVVNGQATLVK